MRWEGRRESSNIEDRRGSGGGNFGGGKGTGVLGIIILLVGAYYGVGRAFVILYAICQFFGQAATLAISIDAPIKFLLSDVDPKFVPHSFTKINEKGIPVSGYKLTGILVSILIIVPALGIGDMTTLYIWLLRLNAICMPLSYLWVFLAYMALKRAKKAYSSSLQFS